MKKTLLFLIAMTLTALTYAADKIGDEAPAIKGLKVIHVTNVADTAKKSETALSVGNDLTLTYKPGTVYVLEFWATWCPPCKVSIPHLDKLQKQYGDKVVIIGITNEEAGKVEKFIKTQKTMDYNIAIDTKGEGQKNLMAPFNARGIPTAFIVGKDGKIAWTGHPMTMDGELAKAVAAPAPNTNAPKAPAALRGAETLKLGIDG